MKELDSCQKDFHIIGFRSSRNDYAFLWSGDKGPFDMSFNFCPYCGKRVNEPEEK